MGYKSKTDRIADLEADLDDCGDMCKVTNKQWISIDDRLPPSDSIDGEFADQLVWGPGVARPVMCYFDGDRWYDSADDEWLVGITHWMPLPEPPAQ